MTPRRTLEIQIERLRMDMYEASNKEESFEEVLQLSMELDELLNELDYIDGKFSTYRIKKDTF